ncbi:MAG: Rpn family recombination-promoting nuclease/putative transposase [Tannerellaceae bacterium]|jgi:predicted transposase/invertase (TIGR01784 family)|nr:Rpn family recombination-promoting nuclease/putative transposase [Tannerellaceae bacterium]
MTSNNNKERKLVSFDWALKRLLRNKANFEVVEGFLSELLERNITIANVLESESNKQHPTDKYNRVDVVVEDDKKEIILIELQFIAEKDYFQRMLYGTSKAIVERMTQGDPYLEIRKIYSINILYFDLGHGTDYIYRGKTYFKGIHNAAILELSESQRRIFGKIEAGDSYPEYFILKVNNFNDVARTRLDEWVYFLKNNKVKENFTAKGLLKACDILSYSRLSKEEQDDYSYLEGIKSHERSQLNTAKDDGKDEGVLETEKKYSKIIEAKDKTLEEQKKTMEDQKKAMEEQKKALEEKDKELEELRRRLYRK